MSAVNSASRAMHTHAAPATRSAASRPAVHSEERGEDFKLNLADIPRTPDSLEVEGFKPSLLSRLFNMIAPMR